MTSLGGVKGSWVGRKVVTWTVCFIKTKKIVIFPDYYLDGYQITLDKKTVKTPHGRHLCVPYQPLAAALSVEWDAQEDVIKPEFMHLVGICDLLYFIYSILYIIVLLMANDNTLVNTLPT